MSDKYQPAQLPTPEDALVMAAERETWAKEARERDHPGTAKEFELTALLLRFYIKVTEADEMMTKQEVINAAIDGEGCLGKAHPDEPVFVLRAQDNLAADLVDKWATHVGLLVPAIDVGSAMAKKVAEAKQIAEAMREWPIHKNPD